MSKSFLYLLTATFFTLTLTADQNWWKNAIFYQIYPRSFKDSDADGTGDLVGIIEKLDHIVDAGVTAIWLSPIYKSPQADMGYDISDYRDVDPIFGSMEDLEKLIEEAHGKGLRVVMDFVPNHTSDEHEWFQKSEAGEEGFEDFYIWREPKDEKGTPPNNWVSAFSGSAWKFSDVRNMSYYHRFAEAQPDLNYRNPEVVKEMKDVLTFWMEKGIDGFRIDAVGSLFEDESFEDEQPTGNTDDPDSNDYLYHNLTLDLPETYDMVYQWREHVDKYAEENNRDAIVLMTETYAYFDVESVMLYYGKRDGSKLGAHFTFNFYLIQNLKEDSTAEDYKTTIQTWLDNIPSIYVSNWVTGNHDVHRVPTRVGKNNIDAINALTLLLPGVGVTYMADEIGQYDGEVTLDQCKDAPNCREDLFTSQGRDFERTPFQWDATKNAGFSEANETWLPVGKTYQEINVAVESIEGRKSHYQVYKKLAKLRKEEAFIDGNTNVEVITEGVFVVVRQVKGGDGYVLVVNVRGTLEVIDLVEIVGEDYLDVVISGVNSHFIEGDTYSTSNLIIGPYETFVAKFT